MNNLFDYKLWQESVEVNVSILIGSFLVGYFAICIVSMETDVCCAFFVLKA